MPGRGNATDQGAHLPRQRRGRCGQGRPRAAGSRAPFEEQAVSIYHLFIFKPKLSLDFFRSIIFSGRRRESVMRLVDSQFPREKALANFTRLTKKISSLHTLFKTN